MSSPSIDAILEKSFFKTSKNVINEFIDAINSNKEKAKNGFVEKYPNFAQIDLNINIDKTLSYTPYEKIFTETNTVLHITKTTFDKYEIYTINTKKKSNEFISAATLLLLYNMFDSNNDHDLNMYLKDYLNIFLEFKNIFKKYFNIDINIENLKNHTDNNLHVGVIHSQTIINDKIYKFNFTYKHENNILSIILNLVSCMTFFIKNINYGINKLIEELTSINITNNNFLLINQINNKIEYKDNKIEDSNSQVNKYKSDINLFTNKSFIQNSNKTYIFPNLQKIDNIIFVDGDNINIDTKIIKKTSNNTLYLFFIAKNSTKLQQLKNISITLTTNNFFTYITQTISKDSTDHLLSFYVSLYINKYPNKKYIIFTKDHFGEAVASFINAAHICTYEELENLLN